MTSTSLVRPLTYRRMWETWRVRRKSSESSTLVFRRQNDLSGLLNLKWEFRILAQSRFGATLWFAHGLDQFMVELKPTFATQTPHPTTIFAYSETSQPDYACSMSIGHSSESCICSIFLRQYGAWLWWIVRFAGVTTKRQLLVSFLGNLRNLTLWEPWIAEKVVSSNVLIAWYSVVCRQHVNHSNQIISRLHIEAEPLRRNGVDRPTNILSTSQGRLLRSSFPTLP